MCVGGRGGGRYLQAVVLRVRLVCPAARLLGVERHVCEVQLVLDCFLTQVKRGGGGQGGVGVGGGAEERRNGGRASRGEESGEGRGKKSERKEER